MAQARLEHDWGQTASLMALIANVHRPRHKRPYKPSDFDPTATSATSRGDSGGEHRITGRSADAFALLKQTFVRSHQSR